MTDDYTFQRNYRIEIRNGTDGVITPCLYWTIAGDTSLQTVAWFSGTAGPTTRLTCDFAYIPGFFCLPGVVPTSGESVVLQPGLTSTVDYAFNNSVSLTYTKAKFVLGTPRPYGVRETLYLLEDAMVPAGTSSVGIAIHGHAALVTASQPSTRLSVPMSLQLNIGIANVTRGTVLDPTGIAGASVIQLPQNVVAMYVIVGNQNEITMSQYPPRQARGALQEST